MNNKTKAKIAKKGIYCAYAEELKIGEDIDTCIQDFLADLIHLCDIEQLDFEQLLERAYWHYREEIKDERLIKESYATHRNSN